MENEIEKPRWWAQALFIGAIVSAVLMVMAGFGTRLGMWELYRRFYDCQRRRDACGGSLLLGRYWLCGLLAQGPAK